VVEDEILLRRMLEKLLSTTDELQLTHSAEGVQDALLVIRPGSSDVAVLDVHLQDGDGVSLGLELQRRDPSLGILLLSSQDDMAGFMEAQEVASKPWSYLSKRSSFAAMTLLRAVAAAANGEQVIDPYLISRSTPRFGSPVARLSPTQQRVLGLVAEGLSNEAISERLGVTVSSVENHLIAVYRALQLPTDGKNRRVLAALTFLRQTSRG